jgi:diacylglycerol diphosphate phosphatase / phosphatidate phosphatase
MSLFEKQDPTLPTHEPQAERFKSSVRRIKDIKPKHGGVSLLLSNLKHWFIDTWLDWLTLLIVGTTTIGVSLPSAPSISQSNLSQIWVAPHAFNRLFPLTFTSSGDIVYPQFAYPYVEPIFSSALAGVLNIVIPISVIVISQLWIESFHVMANGILGLLYAIATGTLFQVVIKKTISGLRPHFLSVCQPVLPPLDGSQGVGYQNIMFTVEQVCTGDKKRIKNALESFPSGHSQIAWAGMGYLALYLFCHLKIRNLSRRRPSHWRMLFVVAPLLFAMYLASTFVLGYHHHGYDVLAGGLIGTMMAFFGYRMVFASIWDPRWNTVPLVRRRTDFFEENINGLDGKTASPLVNGHSNGAVDGHTRETSPV